MNREKTVKQISVFLENKPGKLAEFVKLLREHDIDMRALSLAEASDFGIIRTIVNDPDKAQKALCDAGFISSVTPVLAASVADEPGALYHILDILDGANINLEYTYAFTARKDKSAYVIFRVADRATENVVEMLEASGIKIVPQEEIYDL